MILKEKSGNKESKKTVCTTAYVLIILYAYMYSICMFI